ncbi:glutaminyl-peptide cyclotransferase-like [Impatiens glandulifera]|uniref:glutaminyl-peptide cyclotransferase-like n=1 Tax=Impatiens glandulifera TaxID=253017 RepID=UPI001FB11337|nr:glutaminyl-peptide cyclotransferase-like [Impatiens glandulifera]
MASMASGMVRKKKWNNTNSSNKSYSLKPYNAMASTATPPLSKYKWRISIAVAVLLLFLVIGVSTIPSNVWNFSRSIAPSVNIYSIEIVNEFPHDPTAFTQGLLYGGNDTLFESTGLNGQSSVRKVALRTGKVEAIHQMPYSLFGEGLTLIGERLYQVTWMETTGFIYDRYNLSKVGMFTHQMEDGWGLTTDGKVMYGSDGTSTLYQMDLETLKVIKNNTVKYKGQEVFNLNELEYVNGEIWANVWQTDCIARISQRDGTVLSWILLPKLRKGLLAAGNNRIDVLNGIAWDKDNNRLFVTGKLWPKMFEIKLQSSKVEESSDKMIKNLCIRPKFEF